MAYSFTPTIKPFVISSLYDSIKATRPSQRVPETFYPLGAQIVNGINRYINTQAGVSGPGAGPTGSSGLHFDGSARWLSMGTDLVKDGDIISNLYVSIGKQTEWSDPMNPDTPDTSYDGERQVLDDATAFIRIEANNTRLGIANVPWVSGTVYSQYDPSINQLSYAGPHYCIVNQTSVYKVIDNNNDAASTEVPSGVSSSLIETADGYIWKYVGDITTAEQFDFSTNEFVPAPVGLPSNQYVNGEISTFTGMVPAGSSFDAGDTITVQVYGNGTGATAAARTVTAGSSRTITSLYANAGGSGYTDAVALAWNSDAPGSGAQVEVDLVDGEVDSISVLSTGIDYTTATVLLIGDGTGATATANVVSGQVTSITLTDGGSGYTWVKAYVVPGNAGAIAKAVFSPVNGHGSNTTTELGVRSLLITTKLSPTLNNYLPTEPTSEDGTFRQVALVSGVQGTSTSNRNAGAYLGKANPLYDSPGSLNKYKDGSGYVLYINNISAITHTSSQEEVIKISISL